MLSNLCNECQKMENRLTNKMSDQFMYRLRLPQLIMCGKVQNREYSLLFNLTLTLLMHNFAIDDVWFDVSLFHETCHV
jgi:hypothetical protein